MIRVISDMESVANELHDPATGPEGGGIAERLGTAEDPSSERLPLPLRQLGRTPRGRASADARTPSPLVRTLPPSHRSSIDADHLGNDHGLQSLLQQRDGTQATAF